MKIRKAELSDAKGIAKVHVDSWRTTYANIIPDEYLDQLSYERREQLWLSQIPQSQVFVAVNDKNEVIGFSSGGRERSGKYEGYDGELSSIYILKEYQGLGIGRLLIEPVVNELTKLGINSMIVLVLEDNKSTLFYEAIGGKVIDTVEVEIAGKKLNELVYGWNHLNE
ncbi:GNAT family N-acetyltransferase [Salipaludibacillus keqinensis]|uniref:GNAT family N-acetyltransferase n=1 Tax=Salipaludibacillus keqinensis TaxID=2045207 RepID=A0A323TGK8_9BACI|nr:GNAT family N-acetyltransferase [Salipaludibacillus keqinensis]PYZ93406.1 GNAT family N-acetyltransferase [Salipaludibacillus keqinensis]